jgi:hydroxylamine dehydrogenase
MGADYGVFANGRWYLRKNLQEMTEWLAGQDKGKKP